MALMLPLASAASRGTDVPQVAVVGGSGLLGGTVGVTIRLSNDAANTAASADVDIAFPVDVVQFNLPVTANCRVAERLAATHQIAGKISHPGLLSLAIFARDLEIDPLGDGELATCDFHILSGATAATAPLTARFVSLGDATGELLAVVGIDGAIVIANAPGRCAADCNGDGRATVDEIVRGVGIVLGNLPLSACPALDIDGNGTTSIAELINGVNRVLFGC